MNNLQEKKIVPDKINRPFTDIFIFFLPSFMAFEVKIVGRLFLTEIIIIILFLFLIISKKKLFFTNLSKKFLQLAFLWLCAQIITDIIVGTPFIDYARGWAKISVFIVNFCVLYLLLYGKNYRLYLFAWGLVLGGILTYFINPNIYAIGNPYTIYSPGDPWKFGIGKSVTLLIILLASRRLASNKQGIPVLLLLGVSFFNIFIGFRSLGGVCFLTASYIILLPYLRRMHERMIPFVLLISLIGSSFLALNVYKYIVEFSGNEKRIQLMETQSGKFGILLGGRPHIFSSSWAIYDSPIIGHGSWAKDPKYAQFMYYIDYYGYKTNWGYIYNESPTKEYGLIPTHSHILGAWVEAGIMGAIFWIWVLFIILRVLLSAYKINNYLTVLVVFITFWSIWAIIFNPFGAEERFYVAFYIVLFINAYDLIKKTSLITNRYRERKHYNCS